MRRLLLLTGMLFICIRFCVAAPVKYLGSTPSDGSVITAFDFTLNFDIADAVADLGEGEWGIGYFGQASAGKSARNIKLYEGAQDDGVLLGLALTENVNGKSEKFSVNGDKVSFSFEGLAAPKENQLYTLVITNDFSVGKKGSAGLMSASLLGFRESPLVLTFTGGKAADNILTFQEVSVLQNASYESVSEVRYGFNGPIAADVSKQVTLKEGETIIATSKSMTVEGNTLVAGFGSEILLPYGKNYVIGLPEGAVWLEAYPGSVNKEFNVTVNGGSKNRFKLKSSTPAEGEKGLFRTFEVQFDLPAGTMLRKDANSHYAYLYKESVSEENFMEQLMGNPWPKDLCTGSRWTFLRSDLEPGTEYVLYIPRDSYGLYGTNGGRISEWGNEEVAIHFSTPTREELGYKRIEFGTPAVVTDGVRTELHDGDIMTYVTTIYLPPKDPSVTHEGVDMRLTSRVSDPPVLYDVTGGTSVPIKTLRTFTLEREDGITEGQISVGAYLYEGRDYRIVVPEGSFSVTSPSTLWPYFDTPELSISLKGSTPAEIKLIGSSIEEGTSVRNISDFIFEIEGDVTLAPDAQARCKVEGGYTTYYPHISIERSASSSFVSVHMSDPQTGEPFILGSGTNASIGANCDMILPAGTLFLTGLPEVKNKDITVTLKKGDRKADFIDVTVQYLDEDKQIVTSVTTNSPVDAQTVISVPSSDWKIAKLTQYIGKVMFGTDVTSSVNNGTFTSAELKKNARYEVLLEYASPLVFTSTTGIAELTDSDIKVGSDDANIVVEGLAGGELITVYSVAGMTIDNFRVEPGKSRVEIAAPTGHAYIVRVRTDAGYDCAAKILH